MLKRRSFLKTTLLSTLILTTLGSCSAFAQSTGAAPTHGFFSISNDLPLGAANNQVIMTLLADNAAGKVGVGTAAPQAVLDIHGEAKIGNSGVACSTVNEGAIRYDFTAHVLEYCNGTSWTVIGGGVPAGTIAAFNSTTCPAGWLDVPALAGRVIVADGPGVSGGTVALASNGIAEALTAQSGAIAMPGVAIAGNVSMQPIMPWYALHYCMAQ